MGRTGTTHPDLVAAVRRRLAGQATGTTPVSAGDAAVMDRYSDQALAAQRDAGDTIDYGMDAVNILATPLDDRHTDFIAYEVLRARNSGGIFRRVELFHRDRSSGPWQATTTAYFADNIALPVLQLDARGNGHLLSAPELAAGPVNPGRVVRAFVSALVDSQPQGVLPDVTFAPGVFTTGAALGARSFVNAHSAHGSASIDWTAGAGGPAVSLTNWTLVFGSLNRHQEIHDDTTGVDGRFYFTEQDRERQNFGGLLAPGAYSSISQDSLETIAVVVPIRGLPDVVAQTEAATSVTGTPVAG